MASIFILSLLQKHHPSHLPVVLVDTDQYVPRTFHRGYRAVDRGVDSPQLTCEPHPNPALDMSVAGFHVVHINSEMIGHSFVFHRLKEHIFEPFL